MRGDRETTFGRLLRELRLRAGFSQEQLAEKAGMSATGVGVLEREHRRAPHRATVDLLADALALSTAERVALEGAASRARGRAVAPETVTSHPPVPISTLVGRADDVASIVTLLEQTRVVTITGSGGVGKTRVALEVARRLTERGQSVCFVDLAPLVDGAFVAARIASSVQPPLGHKPDSIAAVADALGERNMVLVLDTCEHVVDDAAAAVHTLLERCSRMKILATSRERLSIASEILYRLPSLPGDAAFELFVARAQEADPRSSFGHDDDDRIRDLCRRLDGIPLAIELAAARVPTLGIAMLHARLDEYMSQATGRRDLPQRQQTMLATIAWSCALLSPPERTLLRRLAVFAGGFTLDSAERVCDVDALDQSFLGLLSSLVDKSLVDVMRAGSAIRYQLLDSVRASALGELRAANEETAAHRRHAVWVARLADRFEADAARMTYDEFKTLELEFDNVRAALAWALDGPWPDDRAMVARIVFGLRSLWHMTGYIAEQRRWIDLGLERIDERSHPREVGQLLRAFILRSWDEAGVIPVIERAIGLFERVGDRRSIAALHSTLTFIYGTLGRFAEADASAERAATLMIEAGMRGTLVYAGFLSNRAALRTDEGRLDDARADIAEAAAVAENRDPYFVVSRCMPRSVSIELAQGNLHAALAIARDMLASEFAESAELQISALDALTFLHLGLGEIEEAAEAARDLLTRLPRDSAPWCHLAAIVSLRGEFDGAARLLGFIDALYARTLLPRNNVQQRSYEILSAELSQRLAPSILEALSAQGAQLTHDEAAEAAIRGLG